MHYRLLKTRLATSQCRADGRKFRTAARLFGSSLYQKETWVPKTAHMGGKYTDINRPYVRKNCHHVDLTMSAYIVTRSSYVLP